MFNVQFSMFNILRPCGPAYRLYSFDMELSWKPEGSPSDDLVKRLKAIIGLINDSYTESRPP